MNGIKNLLKLLVLIILFSYPAAAQEITREGRAYKTKLVQTFNVKPGGSLIIDHSSGDVIIKTWNKDGIEIKEDIWMDVYTLKEAQEIVEHTKNNYLIEGNQVRIRGARSRQWIRRDYEIWMPNQFNLDVDIDYGRIHVETLKGRVYLSTSGGDIDLLSITGDVDIRTSGGDLSLKDINGPIEASTSGGSIDLENLNGKANIKTSGGSIRLIKAKENVRLKTSGGEIEVEQMDGNLIATTSGGDIEIRSCNGDVDVHTSGGNIELNDLKGSVEAETSGGDIRGDGFDGPVFVGTSGGDIRLSNARSVINATTSAGNIDVEITSTNFNKPHNIHLRTSDGDIDIMLPAKFPASISAEIRLETRRWNRYDIYSDFPLKKIEDKEGRFIQNEGDINGGGDAVVLEAIHGNIRIKKGN